jgi:hypothetical protein
VTDSNFGPIELLDNTSSVPGSLRASAGEDGTLAAVWQASGAYSGCCPDLPPGLHASITGPDGHWSSPTLVNESPVTSGPADIVVMADGVSLIVWIWIDQPHEAANDVYVNLWARTVDANGSWAPQQLVGNVSVHYVAFYSPREFGPKIVPGKGGAYGVFWGYNNGDPSPVQFTRCDPESGWTATETIEVPPIDRESYWPAPFGVSHFWKDGHGVFLTTAIDNVSQANDVLAIPYDDGAGLGTPVRLDSIDPGDALFPAIAGNPQGEAFAVWRQWDGEDWALYGARMNAQGSWGNSTLIAKPRWGYADWPNVVMDDAGRVTVVWGTGRLSPLPSGPHRTVDGRGPRRRAARRDMFHVVRGDGSPGDGR